MMYVRRFTILSALMMALQPFSAFGVKMDETTHDMVIQRLELGITDMEKDAPERPGVLMRLADLLADRARLKAMNEMAANCDGCKGAKEDRQRAINLYNEALPKAEKEKQGRVVLQIAHLYALNDEPKKSIALYEQILKASKSTYSSEVKAIANASVGEIHFKKGEFKSALKYYEAARKENLKNRALVQFRIAWCLLNLGQTQKATDTLVALLKNPDLLATQTTDGKTVDPVFLQDASRDLAKFLARGDVQPRHIQLLKDLSPDNVRKVNLHTLGSETDRLGKKQASLVVWAAYVDEGEVKPNEKLEVQTRVAQIFYDMNKLDLATNAYEKAADLWKKHGCTDEDLCEELKTRLKKMVTAWNKAQKKKPTANLFRVYVAYTNVFTEDVEMIHWGAVVGSQLGKHKDSATLFRRAAIEADKALKKDPNNKSMRNIFEGSLLGEIEMAEASKDKKAQEAAYNNYLSMNPNGPQAFQVRYQRAHLFAETGRHRDAFTEFHYLASQPGKDNKDLKVKSADLALDSLVALKDDQALEVRALEYARLHPERKTEYLKISRKATMNLVAANLANEKRNDTSDYKASLIALNKVNLDGADDAEKIKFYKNKIVVAQKAFELDEVTKTAALLLAIKSLSQEDREWAMAQKVWVAELKLDFEEAYRLTKQMSLPRLSKADRELRLALLADLAGLNPSRHNEAYLRLNKDVRAGNQVRITLVKNARRPWNELDKHLRFLKQTPDLLAGLTLEVFARQKDYEKASKLLRTTAIARFAAGQTLVRHLELREFQKFDRKISNHRIYGYSEQAMQKTIKERITLIGQSERVAQGWMRNGDWTMQILTLSQVARENRRMYRDILALPVPRRLNQQQRAEYQALLKQQSDPYLMKAEKIESELERMWSRSNSVQNLQAAYMTASPDLQKLSRDEIQVLAQNAPSRAENRLKNLLNTPFRRPSQRDILLARRALQASPFDISKAEALRELEAQGGRASMVVYLDERIAQLKKGKTL